MSKTFKDFFSPRTEGFVPCPFCGNMVSKDADYCPKCGHTMVEPPKPEPPKKITKWTCEKCGHEVETEHCPDCGKKRPPWPKPTWVCPDCGKRDLASDHCPRCGAARPIEPKPWECKVCGRKDIPKDFSNCPQCGRPKGAKYREKVPKWECPDCAKKRGKDEPKKYVTSPFCPDCGRHAPPPKPETIPWICPDCLGGEGDEITSLFCPQCGRTRPWYCTTCKQNVFSEHCPDCGAAKPKGDE